MKRLLLTLAMPLLLAAAPTPLIVGSIRDQHGAPIAGARISAGASWTQTDAQGTFALEGTAPGTVTISCAYCRTVSVAVSPGEPVVAIVHRYDALAQAAPAARDIASLPYSQAQSVAALHPFTVLENSSHPLPGPQISYLGTSSRGALVLENGIPLYDVATNQSPFAAFPTYSIQSVAWLPPSDAFTYGDMAGGGTVLADSFGSAPWNALAVAGRTSALHAGQTTQNAAWSSSISSRPDDNRSGADALLRVPFGDNTIDFSALAGQDRFSYDGQHLDTSDTGFRLDYNTVRENRVNASIVADGGGYDGEAPRISYSSKWSDVQIDAGVTTLTRIQFFTGAGVRASSGAYWTSNYVLPVTAGAIAQTRVDMGAQTAGDRYSVKLGIGAFDAHYAGGSGGSKAALDGGLVTPSFFGSYALDRHWTLEAQAAQTFALPTILEAFVYPLDGPGLALDRNTLFTQTLTYSDLSRFQASVTDMSEVVRGMDFGTVHSAGISAAWQVAPELSLRAWLLRENDFTQPYEAVYRFGVRPLPATLASYWLQYERSGVRIDAIYRRDLLDYRIDPHFDASVSAPLTPQWRIYGATERLAGTRTYTFGLRTQVP